jgi:hydrogenase maturation protease
MVKLSLLETWNTFTERRQILEPKTLICGFGNSLRRDDGLGAYVIDQLAERELPDYITLRDFGTSGFRAALEIGYYDRVIVIDAIRAGGKPGTLYRMVFGYENIVSNDLPGSFAISLHEVGLEKALTTAFFAGRFPKEVVILGCEPEDVSFGLALSEIVEGASKRLLELVVSEIEERKHT